MKSTEAIQKLKELMVEYEPFDYCELEEAWSNTTIGELKEIWGEINSLIQDIHIILDEVEE
jgi:hypothetical protein